MTKVKSKHIGLRIDNDMHKKLVYVSKYEDRSINGQLLYLIRRCVADFEKEHGKIEADKQ